MARMSDAERELRLAGMDPQWVSDNGLGGTQLSAKYGDVVIDVYGHNGKVGAIVVRRDTEHDNLTKGRLAGQYAESIAQAIEWAKQ